MLAPSVAVVGSRAATSYGERVAFDLADGLTAEGVCVVSGGAYGIDAAAHRGAVARGGRDRSSSSRAESTGPIRRGTRDCWRRSWGPGERSCRRCHRAACPTKSRFLQRNRLIAAAGRATVVVEAAWRSGAMSTAHHAARLLRPVGAVPGPVTSMASAGCHRLLREGVAVCVTDAAEVRELAGVIGSGLVAAADAARSADGRAARRQDALDPVSLRVLDALSRRVPTDARPGGEPRRCHRRRGAGRGGPPGARRVGGPPGYRLGRGENRHIMTAGPLSRRRAGRGRGMRGGEEIRG